MLKKYDDLTKEQKKLVEVMYSDHANLEQYLYNFDGDKYSGRQYTPPVGVIHTEGIESTVKKVIEEVKEVVKPRIKRTKKK